MNNFKFACLFVVSLVVSSVVHAEAEEKSLEYQIKTWRHSHFALDQAGNLIPEQRKGEAFFKVKEGKYVLTRTLMKDKTAVVVMDPWEDSGSPVMNLHFKNVYSKRLVPLVKHAVTLGLKVVIVTNDPATINLGYAARIDPALQAVVESGGADVVYHSNMDDRKFEEYLKSAGVDTLIYTGFSSNVCVIGMPTGMIPMFHRGFKLYFVPEASAATEFGNTWGSGAAHKATTTMISNWIGEIIAFKDFMRIKQSSTMGR
ncbi:isochorismatase family protein [Pseudomonas sp. REB1044]|uniref:isochorismatase family protein n=1 Tax=Pseudomonas sp. REB1044 TaxID=2675224 RepID=UPI00315C8E4E